MNKVAIQGQAGSYHHQAAKKFFGSNLETLNCNTFKDTFRSLETGSADYAVVALENSLYGSINEVYDLLLKRKSWICGETYLRIEHCLVGLPGSNINDIQEVYSQIMALAQCEDYLDKHLPNAHRVEYHDTAASVELIKNLGDPTKAAVASRQAAEIHGLKIHASNIETHHNNYTRFAILSRDKHPSPESSKTSLVLATDSDTEPGALLRALQAFVDNNINLTMLQSRPLIGKAWHYLFYVDIEAGSESREFKSAHSTLNGQGCDVTILGSYKAGDLSKT